MDAFGISIVAAASLLAVLIVLVLARRAFRVPSLLTRQPAADAFKRDAIRSERNLNPPDFAPPAKPRIDGDAASAPRDREAPAAPAELLPVAPPSAEIEIVPPEPEALEPAQEPAAPLPGPGTQSGCDEKHKGESAAGVGCIPADTAPDPSIAEDIASEPAKPVQPQLGPPTDETVSAKASAETSTFELGEGVCDEIRPVGDASTAAGPEADSAKSGPVCPDATATVEATPPASPSDAPPAADDGRGIERRKQQTVYRDRRGSRRRQCALQPEGKRTDAANLPVAGPPAEARLRLVLHPIQCTAQLSLVLSRPEGFPEASSVDLNGAIEFAAFNESRYDDIDVDWDPELLIGELRLENSDGFRWVRSARRVHIFTSDPVEAGLISISAVRLGAEHAIVCKSDDAPLVETIARSVELPELTRHEHWLGIADGWSILSGYIPKRPAGGVSDPAFRPLDPSFDFDIELVGGLAIRNGIYAEGHPPCIEIPGLPEDASVTIGGEQAWLTGTGGWEAPGWSSRGQHVIDVLPGPSRTYEIAADPADGEGWQPWDAHEHRFLGSEPWARARICGAALSGPSGETVLAHEAKPMLVALGARDHATGLQHRPGLDVAVGLLPGAPAFLIASSGQRRHQGLVIWLGLDTGPTPGRRIARSVLAWANAVRAAASRRLPLEPSESSPARDAWQKAMRRARNLKRSRA